MVLKLYISKAWEHKRFFFMIIGWREKLWLAWYCACFNISDVFKWHKLNRFQIQSEIYIQGVSKKMRQWFFQSLLAQILYAHGKQRQIWNPHYLSFSCHIRAIFRVFIGLILDDRLKEKFLKPWKGILCILCLYVCPSVRLSVNKLQTTFF